MSSTLFRLGFWAARHAWHVLAAWLTVILATGALAYAVGSGLDNAFSIPGTEAQDGLDALETRFPELAGTGGQLIFVTDDGSNITAHRESISALTKKAGNLPGIAVAADPFNEQMPSQPSKDGSAIIANIQADPALDSVSPETKNGLKALVREASTGPLDVYVGGQIVQNTDVGGGIMEVLGVLAALVVLAVVFKAVRSAFIPIVTALSGLILSMILMFAATGLIDVSSSAPTLAVMLGLAVGIDYALFIVSRHLGQLSEGLDPVESIGRATATSGSAVIFAGMTVVIALVGLTLTQIPFLAIMGYVSAIAVLANVIAALTLLPAILGLFGERLRPKKQRERTAGVGRSPAGDHSTAAPGPHGDTTAPQRAGGLRRRWVEHVTAHPLVTIALVLAAAIALALPARDLGFALPEQGTDPAGSVTREAYDVTSEKFGDGYNATILVTTDIINTTDPLGVMDGLKRDIAALDGVDSIQLATPNRGADLGVVAVRPAEGPAAESTKNLVHALRDHAHSWETRYGISDLTVTGSTALAIDITERLNQAFLPFALFVVGLSFVLLAIVFRSLWVPLKAALGFVISIGVAFGVTSMVFTYGWGAHLVHAAGQGPVISFLPIIVVGVLFGLAMDYEVFLVTRMREDYTRTGDARASIVSGFVGSSSVVIAAAIIMIVIFAGFVPESDFIMQPIALSLAVGVLVDAFVVRMTFVPAVLAVLGERAWRFPHALEKTLPHMDVEGEGLATALEHRQYRQEHPGTVIRLKDARAFDTAHDTLGPLSGDIEHGTLTLVRGGTAAERHAVLALLGARLEPVSGTVFVGDRSIPGETGGAQRQVAWADASLGSAELISRIEDPRANVVILERASALLDAGHPGRKACETALGAGRAIVALDDAPSPMSALLDTDQLRILDLDSLSSSARTLHQEARA